MSGSPLGDGHGEDGGTMPEPDDQPTDPQEPAEPERDSDPDASDTGWVPI